MSSLNKGLLAILFLNLTSLNISYGNSLENYKKYYFNQPTEQREMLISPEILKNTEVKEYTNINSSELGSYPPVGNRKIDNPKCLTVSSGTPCKRYKSPFDSNQWFDDIISSNDWQSTDFLSEWTSKVYGQEFNYYRYVFAYNFEQFEKTFYTYDSNKKPIIHTLKSIYNEKRIPEVRGFTETCGSNQKIWLGQFLFADAKRYQITIHGGVDLKFFDKVGINVGVDLSQSVENWNNVSRTITPSFIAAVHEPYLAWNTLSGVVYIETYNSKTKKWGYLSPLENSFHFVDPKMFSYPYETYVDNYNPIFYVKTFVKAYCSDLVKNAEKFRLYSNQSYLVNAPTISEESFQLEDLPEEYKPKKGENEKVSQPMPLHNTKNKHSNDDLQKYQ